MPRTHRSTKKSTSCVVCKKCGKHFRTTKSKSRRISKKFKKCKKITCRRKSAKLCKHLKKGG